MHRVISITLRTSEIIDMADGGTYMRNGPDDWSERMGESWEPVYYAQSLRDLEYAYANAPRGVRDDD